VCAGRVDFRLATKSGAPAIFVAGNFQVKSNVQAAGGFDRSV
jgi:hypothetical protein